MYIGHCATQNTLPFMLCPVMLLGQAGGGGALYKVHVPLQRGGVQNHFRHRWVLCEFSVGVNRSSWQGSSSVNIKFVACYHNDIWSEW
jgi:hypothetical protein